jgi:hypothetical protein
MERFSFFPFYVGTTIIVAKQQKKKKNRQSTNLIWQREVYENRVPDCCFYTTRLTAACIASAR